MSDFMGKDGFVWFVGVVEDRDDPERLGRVRVRCLGYHTENKTLIETEDLPWATVMAPTDTPSMNGLGHTPPFIVEGSWVLGFFRDSSELQQPIVLGTLPGFNTKERDVTKGFNDPNGVYPKTIGDSDVNFLARGAVAIMHPSRIKREELRLKKFFLDTPEGGESLDGTSVPTATKPNLKTVSDTLKTDDTRVNWEEPEPAAGSIPRYPYNHTHESEIGHVHEIDDTPGAERLLQQHIAGTFEEIHPDGTKVTKVIGDNYEIVMGGSNIYIVGDVNLTTKGTMKHLVQGDYILEVKGDYTQKIHKNHYMKVGARGLEKEFDSEGKEIREGGGGNREEEIVGSHAISIANAVNYTTGTAPTGPKEVRHVIGGNVTKILSGTDTKQVNGGNSFLQVNAGDMVRSVVGNLIMSTTNPGVGPPPALKQQGQITIAAANKMNLKSATSMNLQTDFDGLNVNVNGVLLTDNDLTLTTLTGSTFNLTVAGAANWNNTGKVTETFLASQKTNITGDLDLDTSLSIDIDALTFITVDADTTIDTVAGTVFTIESGGGNGNASATNKVDINPPS